MPTDPDTLGIQVYPAPVLRSKAKPLPEVNDEVRAVALKMIQLMHDAEGIGLAAPQVGLPWRLFVAHVPPGEDRDPAHQPMTATAEPTVYINPTLSDFARDLEPFEEGCLSLPEITGEVRRPSACTITATDLDGNTFSQSATGLLARCWQHEFDHLEGVLIIDKMSMPGRMRNRAALKELERAADRFNAP